MSRDAFIQHARGTPFDPVSTSIRSTNLQEVAEELRKQTVYDPQYTVTTLNGNTPLDTTSSTLQFFTGSAINHDLTLPNATTLFNGQLYIVVNESSAAVHINDFTGTQLFEVLAESIATIFLQSNGTSAGVWTGYVVSGFATGILSYNVTSSVTFSTTSATDTLITGFTVTPVAGRYAVWSNARMQNSNGSATNFWTLYKGGSIISDSRRGARFGAASTDFPCPTQTVISVNGTQAIDMRVRRDGGTLTVYDRSLTLIRLGPEI
jgi:hypothetical protein